MKSNYGPFCGMTWRGSRQVVGACGFWFRVFGFGLHVSNRKRSDAMFSERNGFRRAYYAFGWRLEFLKP